MKRSSQSAFVGSTIPLTSTGASKTELGVPPASRQTAGCTMGSGVVSARIFCCISAASFVGSIKTAAWYPSCTSRYSTVRRSTDFCETTPSAGPTPKGRSLDILPAAPLSAEIAQARVRYGYRKIRVLLNREGWNVGKYLVYRLYKEEGLTLKRMKPAGKRKA